MPVVDVHTHMLDPEWLALLEQHGGHYRVGRNAGGSRAILKDSTPFLTLTDGMFDYEARIREMDAAGVDTAVVSLTCPNVFWGGESISTHAAEVVNDGMAAASEKYPGRIRWFASLPWQYADFAVRELSRALSAGASGVLVLGNVASEPLTAPRFEPIWRAIDDRGLPVLVHPTAPPGVSEMSLEQYHLAPTVGFTFDTTLAISRMVFDGFFERFPNLKLVASHGGGQLPYIAGRLDHWFDHQPGCRTAISHRPSEYLKKIYYDAIVYNSETLKYLIDFAGEEQVLFGSDFPHRVGDMAGCRKRIEECLSADVASKVLGGNAAQVFDT